MSRTYRKKKAHRNRYGNDLEYKLRDGGYSLEEILKIEGIEKIELSCYGGRYYTAYDFYYSKTSKKGKQIVARWHSDAGVNSFKEPGPMWYVREFTQVPYRARAKQEIHKFFKDEEYEVIIESMPHLDYWT